MSRDIQAKDIMQTNVITLTPETPLAEARDVFLRQRISGAPVIEEGVLVGVVSLSDLVRVALGKDSDDFPENSFFIGLPPLYGTEVGALTEQLEERYVEEAMSTDLYTAAPDDRLAVLAVAMRHHKIHRLIICEDKKVVGVVSTFDLIQVLENH